MKKNAILLIIITGATSLFGFAKSMTLAYFYGASIFADAYIIATTIPALFFSFFGHAVKSGVIPIYNDVEEKKGHEKAHFFLNNVLGFLTISLTLFAFLIAIFSSHLVSILGPGLNEAAADLATSITRVTAFAIILQGATTVFKTYLNINSNFIIPAMSIIPLDIVILISIVLSVKYGVMFLAYGYLAGALVQTIMLIVPLIKSEYSYRLILKFNDQSLKNFFALIVPILFSVAVNDVNKMVDKALASLVAVGGVSALNYSSRLVSFVQSTIIVSISTVAFPAFAKYCASNNIYKLKKSIIDNIKLVMLLIVPAIFGIVFYSSEIIELLYGRGTFDEYAISLTRTALIYYSIGILGFGLNSIYTRYFYATKMSKIPMTGAILSSLTNVSLNFGFYYFTNLGIGGLALSTSIAEIVNSIFLGVMTHKKIGKIIHLKDYIYFLKILSASSIMILVSKLCQATIQGYLALNTNLITLLSIIISIIIYFVILTLLKVSEVSEVSGYIKHVLQKMNVESKQH